MSNAAPSVVFAVRMRAERELLGLSQAEMARRISEISGIKLDPSAVHRIEQQTRVVRLDEAVAIAKVLELPLIDLIAEEPEQSNAVAIQHYRRELQEALHNWEQQRIEIGRLTRILQKLNAEAY